MLKVVTQRPTTEMFSCSVHLQKEEEKHSFLIWLTTNFQKANIQCPSFHSIVIIKKRVQFKSHKAFFNQKREAISVLSQFSVPLWIVKDNNFSRQQRISVSCQLPHLSYLLGKICWDTKSKGMCWYGKSDWTHNRLNYKLLMLLRDSENYLIND